MHKLRPGACTCGLPGWRHGCSHGDTCSHISPSLLPAPATILCRLIATIGLERGLDTLVWQLIASVAAPGYTIHSVVAAANWALQRVEQSQQVALSMNGAAQALGVAPDVFLATLNKSVPTALGLLGEWLAALCLLWAQPPTLPSLLAESSHWAGHLASGTAALLGTIAASTCCSIMAAVRKRCCSWHSTVCSRPHVC